MQSAAIDRVRMQLRAQMPVAAKWAYLDHAAVAPLTQPAVDAMAGWLQQASEEGDTVWTQWVRQVEQTRRRAAQLIGAKPDEIALVGNTTAGINLVAEGLDWRSGDNVVTLDDEFPSNIYPWIHLADRGVETRLAPTDEGRVDFDALEQLCDDRTRVLTVSWIGYRTGCRRDLDLIGEIARRHDAYFLVDAIQGVGAFPLDVSKGPIDFLAADGHKWQLGPEGAGFAYVRDSRLAELRATGVGWNSVVHAGDFSNLNLNFKQTASRFEGGSHNMCGMMALGASLQLLDSLGLDNIAAAILQWTDRACERLAEAGAVIASPRERELRSGIVAFELPDADPQLVRRRAADAQVALACRGGRLRLSAHAYNNEDDLERLLEVIADVPRG